MLITQKVFESEAEVEEFFEKNQLEDNLVVQSLIFDKDVFVELSEAIEWAKTHYFFYEKIDEGDKSIVITQYDKSEFILDTSKTIEIRRGVKASVGELIADSYCSAEYLSLRNTGSIKLSDDLPHVIELANVVKGYHASYGVVEITKDMLKSFLKNFNENAVGVDLSIDYDHETREAAGWIKSVFLSFDESVLLGAVKWTPKGALALSDREFRYFSPEFHEAWVHPHTRKEHGPTLLGGALVNRPFLKMEAIVSLKDKQKGKTMETIALKEHNEKLEVLNTEIKTLKEDSTKINEELVTVKEENKTLSEKVKTLNAEKASKEKNAKLEKLFSENKINKAQLDAMKENKDVFEVLSLSEKMNTEVKGTKKENDVVELSDKEKELCKKLELTEAEYIEANKEGK